MAPDDLALLHEHGDTQVPAGHLDLAVNVHPEPPPGLAEVLAGVDVRAYPDATAARAAVAARHGVGPEQVLLTNGAAEAFWALAHAQPAGAVASASTRRSPRPRPPCAAPASRSGGWSGAPRTASRSGPEEVDPAADLVVLGRPDNPTGRSEDVEVLARLAAPGRLLVVDEAFAEHRGDGLGLTADRDRLPGLVQVRSLTKVWGAAGLRLGYVVAEAPVVRRLAATLQPWPVNAVALAVLERLFGPGHRDEVEAERRRRVAAVDADRADLVPRLHALGLDVHAGEAPYLLLRGGRSRTCGAGSSRTASRSGAATPSPASTTGGSASAVPGRPGADRLVAALAAATGTTGEAPAP